MELPRTQFPGAAADATVSFLASWLLVLGICYLSNTLISNKDAEQVPLQLPPFGDTAQWNTYEYDTDSSIRFPPVSDALRWMLGTNTGWYLTIIEGGYKRSPFSSDTQANWAFLPVFPLLVRAITPAASTLNYLVAGWLLSVTFYFLSLYALRCLLALDFDPETASRSLLLLAYYPFSFNLMIFGSESLFLFLVCAAFYAARKQRWWVCGLLAGIASATRVQGALLSVPFAYMYLRSKDFQWRKLDRSGLGLFLAPAGIVLFMFHLYRLTGNPLAFLQIQSQWGNSLSYPFASIYKFLKSPHIISHHGWDVQILSVLFTLSVVPLLVWVWRRQKISTEYTLFLALQLFVLVSRTSTISNLRHLLGAFPYFLALGIFGENPRVFLLLLVFFASLLGLFVALFANGFRVAFA